VYFWWFELGLRGVVGWTGALYAFVVLYAITLYLLCVVIVPTDPPPDYRAYYFSRWILGVLLASMYIDAVDSFLKVDMLGETVFTGRAILTQLALVTALIVPGFFVKKAWYHGAVAILSLLNVLGGLLSRSVTG
jgi:hypothetical protein